MNCKAASLPAGLAVNVSNPGFSCSIGYTATAVSDAPHILLGRKALEDVKMEKKGGPRYAGGKMMEKKGGPVYTSSGALVH